MEYTAISTVIPTYNRAPLLSRAISSALLQMKEEDELIVVDDGSSDYTKGLAARYGDRIRYIKTENRGAGGARNRGIQEAKNPLIAFLDSDDEWMPYKMQIQRSFMQARPDILFSFANQSFRKKDGTEKRFSMRTWPGVEYSWEEIFGKGQFYSSLLPLPKGLDDFLYYSGNIYLQMLTGIYIAANTIMVRRLAAGDALHFAEDTKTYEDWECFGRLAGAGTCAYLDIEMSWQNTHSGDRLTDFGGFERHDARLKIIERVWGKDHEFLQKYGTLYKSVLDKERLSVISGYILQGRTDIARKELSKLSVNNLPRKLLASLPAVLAKYIAKMMQKIRTV